MKKIILNSLMITLSLGVTTSAFAAENAQPIKALREERAVAKDKLQDIRKDSASSTDDKKELRREIASTTKTIRDQVKEKIKNLIERRFGKMFTRYQATIERETQIMNKINTRIEKIKTSGGTTTEAEKLVLDAKTHLDEAQKELTVLKNKAQNESEIASSTTQTISKDTLKAMNDSVKNLEKEIRAAHQSLQKTVGALRGSSKLEHATSTGEHNN